MRQYCQEYLAYCAAHKKTPEAMMAHDEKEYPGGCMCGWILWVQRVCRDFARAHPEHCVGDTIRNHDAKIKYMQTVAAEEAAKSQ